MASPTHRLVRIDVQNYKCFKKHHIFSEFEKITAFKGTNGSGKSTLIEAIGFALGETSITPTGEEDYSNIVNNPKVRCAVSLKFELESGDFKRLTRIIDNKRSRFQITNEDVEQKEYMAEIEEIKLRYAGQLLSVYNRTNLRVTRKSPKELAALFDALSNGVQFKEKYDELAARSNKVKRDINKLEILKADLLEEDNTIQQLFLFEIFMCERSIEDITRKIAEETVKQRKSSKPPSVNDIKSGAGPIPKQSQPGSFKHTTSSPNSVKEVDKLDELQTCLKKKQEERKQFVSTVNQTIGIGLAHLEGNIDFNSLPDEYKQILDQKSIDVKRFDLRQKIETLQRKWRATTGFDKSAKLPPWTKRASDCMSERERVNKEALAIQQPLEAIKNKRRSCFMKFFTPIADLVKKIYKEIAQDEDSHASLLPIDEKEPYLGIDVFLTELYMMGEPTSTREIKGGSVMIAELSLVFALQEWNPSPLVIIDDIDRHMYDEACKKIEKYMSKREQTQYIVTCKEDSHFQRIHKCHILEEEEDTEEEEEEEE